MTQALPVPTPAVEAASKAAKVEPPSIASRISDQSSTRLAGMGLLGAGLYVMRPTRRDQVLPEGPKGIAGAGLYLAGAYLALSDHAAEVVHKILARSRGK